MYWEGPGIGQMIWQLWLQNLNSRGATSCRWFHSHSPVHNQDLEDLSKQPTVATHPEYSSVLCQFRVCWSNIRGKHCQLCKYHYFWRCTGEFCGCTCFSNSFPWYFHFILTYYDFRDSLLIEHTLNLTFNDWKRLIQVSISVFIPLYFVFRLFIRVFIARFLRGQLRLLCSDV